MVHPEQSLKIGIVADPQYSTAPEKYGRFFQNSLQKLEEAIETFNKQEVDLVLNLGDTIDEGFQHFEAIMPLFAKLQAPTYHILGNHDFAIDEADKKAVRETLFMPSQYYSIINHSTRFIFLDGTDLAYFTENIHKEKANELAELWDKIKGQENARRWNGGVSRMQFSWLETELESSRQNNERVVICCHYPICPTPFKHNLWNDREMLNLLDKHDHIIAWFNGHNHQGNYKLRNGVHHLNFHGMVETKNENAYAIADLSHNSLSINGFGRQPSFSLSFE